MWIPTCCSSEEDANKVVVKMRNQVNLHFKKLDTNIDNGIQKNSYNNNFVISKRCHIKDRSLSAQDSAINDGIRNLDNSKELIFENFNITNLIFNEVEWNNSRFKVLSSSKLATVRMDGKLFIASDNRPFISILIGLKKL